MNLLKIAYRYRVALSLVLVNLLAYGLLAPKLGFYGDDWGYIWLLTKGPGLQHFLGRSRVGFIPVYQVMAALLGAVPLRWALAMLALRTINSLCFWLIVRRCFPGGRAAWMASLLYAVYPGFYLTSLAVNLSMFFVLLTCLYLSFHFNLVWAGEQRSKGWLVLPALLLSAVNLLLAEYFFFMELARPLLLYLALSDNSQPIHERLRSVWRGWRPFLVLFLLAAAWRSVYQARLNAFYSVSLLTDLRQAPWKTIAEQLGRMLSDLYRFGFATWFHALYPQDLLGHPQASARLFFAALAGLFVLLLTGIYLGGRRRTAPPTGKGSNAAGMIAAGTACFLISGWSIWLAKLQINPMDFTTTRFTEPMMAGAALIAGGILQLVPRRWNLQLVALSVLLSGAIAQQLLIGNIFRRDWELQESFSRQMTWRFPGLHRNTLLLITRFPTDYGEENAVAASLDWLYSPGNPDSSDYYAYINPDKFALDLGALQPGQEVRTAHLIGGFNASLDRSVGIYLDPKNCLRVLYPEQDLQNTDFYPGQLWSDDKVNRFFEQYLPFTRPDQALAEADPAVQGSLAAVYGSSYSRDWCWLYQVADLASRRGDWGGIVRLADQSLDPEQYGSDPQKLAVFIEAYLRQGRVDQAREVFSGIRLQNEGERTVFCRTISRWREEIPLDGKSLELLRSVEPRLGCSLE